MAKSSHPLFHAVDALTARLPFALDDIARINAVYAAWHAAPAPEEGRWIDLWTHAYVRRYVIVKHLREPFREPADVDDLIERIFLRIYRSRDQIHNPDRYAHWVSRICRNTYLSYRRPSRTYASTDGLERTLEADADDSAQRVDQARFRQAVEQAIPRLPPFLRETATRYFLQEQPYEVIAEAIGKPIPSVRAYVSKAAARLRSDPTIAPFRGSGGP